MLFPSSHSPSSHSPSHTPPPTHPTQTTCISSFMESHFDWNDIVKFIWLSVKNHCLSWGHVPCPRGTGAESGDLGIAGPAYSRRLDADCHIVAYMRKPACYRPTPTLVKTLTDFCRVALCSWRRESRPCQSGLWWHPWDPWEPLLIGVLWAVRAHMALLEAVWTAWYGLCSVGKRFAIKALVQHWPVEAPPHEGHSPKLAVVHHLATSLIVSLGPDNHGLVGKQFWCLMRKSGGDQCRH